MANLTPKQQRFVDEYLIDLNATQAAIRTGYAEGSADVTGARLIGNASVKAAIDEALAKRAKKLNISSERVLEEIASMAFYDPAELMVEIEADESEGGMPGCRVSDDGKLYGLRGPTDIRNLPEKVRRAIVGWSWDRNMNFVVKLADKSKALDQLARHLSLYNDRLEVNGLDALADRLARAKARRRKGGDE